MASRKCQFEVAVLLADPFLLLYNDRVHARVSMMDEAASEGVTTIYAYQEETAVVRFPTPEYAASALIFGNDETAFN